MPRQAVGSCPLPSKLGPAGEAAGFASEENHFSAPEAALMGPWEVLRAAGRAERESPGELPHRELENRSAHFMGLSGQSHRRPHMILGRHILSSLINGQGQGSLAKWALGDQGGP